MNTEFSAFVFFWSGACLCLTYQAVMLVSSNTIRWGESGATTVACLCIPLILLDLLVLLEYESVICEEDDQGGDEE